jgi:hypothetical protein
MLRTAADNSTGAFELREKLVELRDVMILSCDPPFFHHFEKM